MLDTHGYLLYLNGQSAEALPILEECVGEVDTAIEELDPSETDPAKKKALAIKKEALAVTLFHRGLVYRELGKEAAALQDLNRAKSLGYSPEHGVH